MRHGYTNDTLRDGDTVVKRYRGPGAGLRADAEFRALSALGEVVPLPPVRSRDPDGTLRIGFVAGRHGQELMDEGRAREVLTACGRTLRVLHAADPALLGGTVGDIVVHGDFGPNNLLLDPGATAVAAVLDWEFCHLGAAIEDLAWCEWIVRMHHPHATSQLDALFDAYGDRPDWHDRRAEMLRRCDRLGAFTREWDPTGAGWRTWRDRSRTTAGWTDED